MAPTSSTASSPKARGVGGRPWLPVLLALAAGLGLGAGLRGLSGGSAPYSLQISSTPEGAAVVLDGQARGLTPLVVEVPEGEQVKIEVRKPGFRPYVALLPRRGASASFVYVTLDPAP